VCPAAVASCGAPPGPVHAEESIVFAAASATQHADAMEAAATSLTSSRNYHASVLSRLFRVLTGFLGSFAFTMQQ